MVEEEIGNKENKSLNTQYVVIGKIKNIKIIQNKN